MIEFVKQLQKHNAEIVSENKELKIEIKRLKDKQEQILKILDADYDFENKEIEPLKIRTLAEALNETESFPISINGIYGKFNEQKNKTDEISWTMKFNLLMSLSFKMKLKNTFNDSEKQFILMLKDVKIKDITDEQYDLMLKIAENQNLV